MKRRRQKLPTLLRLKCLYVNSGDRSSGRHAGADGIGLRRETVLRYGMASLLAVAMTMPLPGHNSSMISDEKATLEIFDEETALLQNDDEATALLQNDDEATLMEAYMLRINGKADEAETMLQAMIKNGSTNAQVYFELARTKQHMLLGGQQVALDEIVQAGRQAVSYAPENITYSFYYAVSCLTDAYMGLMQQQQDATDKLAAAADAFEAVLAQDPDCYEAMLYLVDIYGVLPDEMGGDRQKAETYVATLEQKDKYYGAIARSRIVSESTDQISYWNEAINDAGNDDRYLEELGRAYLLQLDTENGTRYYQEAIQADPEKRDLAMKLVRYHVIMSQQNPDQKEKHLQSALELANTYLNSEPELTQPQKGHACQIMAMIKNFEGDAEGRDAFLAQAASFDPFYSRASGVPAEMLYCPPDQIRIQYSSFFLPF